MTVSTEESRPSVVKEEGWEEFHLEKKATQSPINFHIN
jgi:hypothetical protein